MPTIRWVRGPARAEELGRPSVKAARAALRAHLDVSKGDPIRAAVSSALREERGLGGHERRFVAFASRELSRHQRFLDLAAKAAGHPPGDWARAEDRALVRYVLWRRLFTGAAWRDVAPEVRLPGPVRPRTVADQVLESVASGLLDDVEVSADPVERASVWHSLPGWMGERLAARAGPDRTDALFGALNREPDVFLRARPPGARERVLAELRAEGVSCEPVAWAPDAIRVTDPGMRVFETAAMKQHRAQVQEPGSQLIALLCRAESAMKVADVCAGAGGKTIALADMLGDGGHVFAGERSGGRLAEARRRARESGARNVSFPKDVPIAECDVVLVDAPCSGTGSLAREPEQKWRLTPKRISELVAAQREIAERAAAALRPGAALVYATCSLLREENEAVVEGLLQAHPELALEPAGDVLPAACAPAIEGPYLSVWPDRLDAGGFFAARLRRTR